jgi:hypothetical protein
MQRGKDLYAKEREEPAPVLIASGGSFSIVISRLTVNIYTEATRLSENEKRKDQRYDFTQLEFTGFAATRTRSRRPK